MPEFPTNAAPLVAWADTETDGLLAEVTVMHCLGIIFSDGRKVSAADQPGYGGTHVREDGFIRCTNKEALRLLAEADIRVWHNGLDFDEQVLLKLYPEWRTLGRSGKVIDTLVVSKLLFPDIFKRGPNNHRIAPKLRLRHSLEAWGGRLGEAKGDYSEWCKEQGLDPWACWRPEMQDYMDQDIVVLRKLFNYLMSQKPTPESSELEHSFQEVIQRQEQRGFRFDHPKALVLLAEWQGIEQQLEAELIAEYGEWWQGGKTQVVRATRRVKLPHLPDITRRRFSKTSGKELKPYVGPPECVYDEGAHYTPIKRVEFNPSSRDHVRIMLYQRHGWKPTRFTKKGAPIVDDDVLRALPFPEAGKLARYYLVLKRIGAMVGAKGWIALARQDAKGQWRIHGRVNTQGALGGRCTHSDPNMTGVPKVQHDPDTKEPLRGEVGGWGWECRELFIPGKGYNLVGFDASSLELRELGHYVAPWDGGEYAKVVSSGDPHQWLADLIRQELVRFGINISRDNAKTAMYAYIYGAGDEKLGSIILPLGSKREKCEAGRALKEALLSRFAALGKLQSAIEDRVEAKGYLVGLDGRKLPIRKAHAAVNLLLQSAGALCMKRALVILDTALQAAGAVPGLDYEFVVNAHDEAQAEVTPEWTERYIRLALESVPAAGRAMGLRCPLKAEAKTGQSWAETH